MHLRFWHTFSGGKKMGVASPLGSLIGIVTAVMGLLYFVILAALIFLNYTIAKKFEEIVFDKGYGKELKAFHMCFWLGIVGYLYVIALPNKNVGNARETTAENDA